jgi:hypothetical protein
MCMTREVGTHACKYTCSKRTHSIANTFKVIR